jgi:hypothetical protein
VVDLVSVLAFAHLFVFEGFIHQNLDTSVAVGLLVGRLRDRVELAYLILLEGDGHNNAAVKQRKELSESSTSPAAPSPSKRHASKDSKRTIP